MITEQQIADFASQSFALPDTCERLRSMLDQDNTDMDDIARVISLDPSLSAKLLKLANSALFRFPSAVNSVAKALNIIGGEAMYNLALIETVNSAFQHFATSAIDLNRFWRQSVNTALLAKHLGKQCRIRGSESLFTLGLMHNLAEVVVAKKEPDLASQCERLGANQMPWERQQEVMGFSYVFASSFILDKWRLPEHFCYVLAKGHDYETALTNREVGVVYLSIRLGLHMTDPQFPKIIGMDNELMAKLALETYDITNTMRMVAMEAQQLLSLMNPDEFAHD